MYGYNFVFLSELLSVFEVLDNLFRFVIDVKFEKVGYILGFFVFVMDKCEFKKGLVGWVVILCFLNGWGDLCLLLMILVENYLLKFYK